MKLILTGASGFIGLETLSHALSHPHISSVVALTRKPLPPSTAHPKLQNIIMSDFSSYEPSVLSQIAGAEACIWLIGEMSTNIEVARRSRLEYGMAAARAFASLPILRGKTFKYVFVSGIVAVRDQDAWLWLYSEVRKMGGQAENEVLAFAKGKEDFESIVARPAAVLSKDGGLLTSVRRLLPSSVGVGELAAVLVDVAITGSDKEILYYADLKKRGKELVKK